MSLFDYFGRVEIIHLPSRADRLDALRIELARAGLDIDKASIPAAPVMTEANGFPSAGVYGNFLSHLQIIQRAYDDGLESVLILEDDAIFSRRFAKRQQNIVDQLSNSAWDIAYIGHSLSELPTATTDLVPFKGDLMWAHCYAINIRIMPRLLQYLLSTIETPSGDPRGGKLYIDAAFTLFRQQNPDVICLVSAPCLSVQKGTNSDLGRASHYRSVFPWLISVARQLRDECWRHGLVKISPN